MAVALVVPGCSGGDDPPPPLKSSPLTSQTTTATTSAAAPSDIPPAARAHTPAGAVAFVKYFYDQLNRAWTTPATGLLKPLSDSGCLSCQAFEASAKELFEKNHRYESDPVTISGIHAVVGGPKGQQYVSARLYQHEVDVVDQHGRTVSTDEARTASTTIALLWTEGGWRYYDSI